MEFRLKFVWLGKLSLLALSLMLAGDLILLCNFPMHLYAMYLGLALCLVAPYFVVRVRQARAEGRRALPHVWRLFVMTLTGFVLTLAWSLVYFNYEGAFQGLDPTILGPKVFKVFISNCAVKAVVLALTLVCLADAFQRGKGGWGGQKDAKMELPPLE